ncbi:MAG: glycosyl hydrolase 53 family protein [Lachnospiraceae bacterium]|nr:glycosyl hydrolase 53 family protein [Lachnospiraceae bacterium]
MKKSVLSFLLAAMLLVLSACGGTSGTATDPAGTDPGQPGTEAASTEKEERPVKKIEGNSLYVRKVENMPADFILGMDASAVPALEASGVKYYNFKGEEQDVFQTLAECGVSMIRVRVWNDPFDAEGHGFGGGNCTADTAAEIGKRAAQYGLSLLVDFHYSDFWADPGKQMEPRAWKGLKFPEKIDALYRFTKESLEKLNAAGVKVGMVQIGNETNGAMAGAHAWEDICEYMKAGSRAVREVCPEALVAVHFANPEKADSYRGYADYLKFYGVDYDVFGSSYYPYWHGTLENLASVLNGITAAYGKKVAVLETSYAYTPDDTDFSGNTIGEGTSGITKNYPFTQQGQVNSLTDVVDTAVNKMTDCIGVFYWEGTWISVGTDSWEANHTLWEKYGSGWASSYAAVYDPDDAGKYYGGCAVDNQAFFDASGRPLESLQVFNLMRFGNEVPLKADAPEDVTLMFDLNGEIEMPEKIFAVMNDGSRQEVDVTWQLTDEDIARMKSGGVAVYDVKGEAAGMEAKAQVSMIEYNFLQNYSFEEGDAGWTVTDLAKADELRVENKATDSMTGPCHYHFWSAAKNSVEFTLEQEVKDLPAGKYKFAISIMGGDAGDTDIYAYVKIGGEIADTAPMKITSYGNWDTGRIGGIEVEEGQTVSAGIYVKCAGAGNGAWGKIDDALLNTEP